MLISEKPHSGAASARLEPDWIGRIFARPALVLILSLLPVIIIGAGLGQVRKDPSVDAFVPADHPAALTRDRAREVFGLEDPAIIVFATPDGSSIFVPDALDAINAFTAEVGQVPGVSRGRIVSLTTEAAIRGEEGDLYVDPIWEGGDQAEADAAWARVLTMPMLVGTLAAVDGSAAMVIVPVDDPNHAEAEAAEIRRLAADAAAQAGLVAHVAGVTAMNARLSELVSSDTVKFLPAVFLTVIGTMWMSLRRFRPLIGALVVIGGSALVAIGSMGWADSRYYLITTALPVVVITIAVADSIHLTLAYLKERRLDPDGPRLRPLSAALRRTGTPITITSVTTALGFVGLSIGTTMTPISEFGIFAAVGVVGAWILSVTALPAIILLTRLEPVEGGPTQPGRLDRILQSISGTAAGRPLATLGIFGAVCAAMLITAFAAEFDYQRKSYFRADDPVRVADQVVNDRFAGGNFLDVLVSAPQEGGLVTSSAMAAIADLESRLEAIDGVRQVTGIADYVSLMHERLTDAAPGSLPDAANAPAQYLLLYESSGDPGDFDEEIDYAYTKALLRAQLATDRFRDTQPIVERFERIAADWSSTSGLAADVGGRVAVNDGWMNALIGSHFTGLAMALVFVVTGTILLFRSLWLGVLAAAPMLSGVLLVYAAMGLFGIDIAPATSMCAALATGLGVDFGVHLGKEIRLARSTGLSVAEAVSGRYVLTAKACALSALSLAAGFLVITISDVPVLRWFGILVAAATAGSLIGALVTVPALSSLVQRKEVIRVPASSSV
jgi:predicted RND superfamily exporter protein